MRRATVVLDGFSLGQEQCDRVEHGPVESSSHKSISGITLCGGVHSRMGIGVVVLDGVEGADLNEVTRKTLKRVFLGPWMIRVGIGDVNRERERGLRKRTEEEEGCYTHLMRKKAQVAPRYATEMEVVEQPGNCVLATVSVWVSRRSHNDVIAKSYQPHQRREQMNSRVDGGGMALPG